MGFDSKSIECFPLYAASAISPPGRHSISRKADPFIAAIAAMRLKRSGKDSLPL